MATRKLTQDFVNDARAEEGAERTVYWDERKPSFGLMVTSKGAKSFVIQYRAAGRSRRMTLRAKDGQKAGLNIVDARKMADSLLGDVAKDRDPLEEQRKKKVGAANTLKSIAEDYFEDQTRLRSIDQKKKLFKRLVFKKLGGRDIASIRRREVAALLKAVEKERGPRMASVLLAALSKLFNWYATQEDDFRSPLVKGMRQSHINKRDRVLSDDEIRALWKATGLREDGQEPILFDRYIRFLFLTATRPNEPAKMRQSELKGPEWIIPAARYKTSWKTKQDLLVPLSARALDELRQVKIIGRKNDSFVFTHDGRRPLGGFSKFKADLDERSDVTDWQLRDLRRTARTLMSRAGIISDHAERALGHVMGSVRGHYDIHEYKDEKLKAFEALSAQIERIVNPPPSNVTELRPATAAL